jgi:UDP-glucose 4-epimerase
MTPTSPSRPSPQIKISPQRVLVTGAAGFIGGYLVPELLGRGYLVTGLDSFSRYGPVRKSYDSDPSYSFVQGDASDVDLMKELSSDCDHLIAGAALTGDDSSPHSGAYDMLAANERVMAATCDGAIQAFRTGRLKKVTYLSSSMVYESSRRPCIEGDERQVRPPVSSFGFQRLAVEYFARAAWDQHGLPYTIVRPFDCVGTGEQRALSDFEIPSGNVKLAMGHVVPDLVRKILKGQDALHLPGGGTQIRHLTYAGDLAAGIAVAMQDPAAANEDFNLSTAQPTTMTELAREIWTRVNGDLPLTLVPDGTSGGRAAGDVAAGDVAAGGVAAGDRRAEHDVRRRVPDVDKARRVLGFEATTSLGDMLGEVIPWIQHAVADGLL